MIDKIVYGFIILFNTLSYPILFSVNFKPTKSLWYKFTYPTFLNIKIFFIYSEQYPCVPRKLTKVFYVCFYFMNIERPKSINMHFLKVGLYAIFSGFMSEWTKFKECIIFKLYVNCYYNFQIVFYFNLIVSQSYIANIALFSITTIS